MEKNILGKGQYVTTGTMFIRGEFKPGETKIALTEQWKAAILECLTESDEFHKLVCDITGVERKQEKVSPELEKLKEDYSHMCENYEHEKQKRNDFIRLYKEENAKRLEVERERDCAQRHHKFIMDEITSMLKEVECGSVRGIVDVLKAERANGKLLAEENELCRRDNEKLKISYDKLCEEIIYVKRTKDNLSKEYDKLEDYYNKLAGDYKRLNERNQTQAGTIENQMKEISYLRKEFKLQSDLTQKYRGKSEKLQGKLDKASKRYGELIKTISDRAIKSI